MSPKVVLRLGTNKMFGRLKVYIIMFSVFAMFAGVAYWYYQDTQAAMKQYAANQAKLESALQTQAAAYEALQRDMELMQKTQQELADKFAESRKLTASLETLFKEDSKGNPRDFGTLAAEDPEFVTEELNTGTREVFECFEQLSGNEESIDDKTYIDCFGNTDNDNSLQ